MRLQRLSQIVLPLFSVAVLAACDFGDKKQSYYTYCDDTGCYSCDVNGCNRTGQNNNGGCRASSDCTEGCYCDQNTGQCVEAGFCDKDSDCSQGMVCDVGRHSCGPATPPVATPCKADQDCKPNESCTNGQCAPKVSPPGACAQNSDCKTGESCVAGKCTPTWQCAKDADCGQGMICDGRNTCVPGPGTCAKDGDCAQGSICTGGKCVATGVCKSDADCTKVLNAPTCDLGRGTCGPKPMMGGACKADCDCPAHEKCSNGACVASGLDGNLLCQFNYECGNAGAECVNGTCHAKCAVSADCGTGDICQGGFCFANPKPVGGCVYNTDCGGGKYCINGACHASCQMDGQCTNKVDFCDAGVCSPDWRKKAQCTTNAQCTNGQECVNAVCRTHCGSDNDCGSCKGMPLCKMGYCTSQAEAMPQCKLQVDCGGAPKNCVNASCL